MKYNTNKFKVMTKGLIGPNIIFPVAYILFSAERCTYAANNIKEANTSNTSLPPKPLVEHKIAGVSASTGQIKASNQLSSSASPVSLSQSPAPAVVIPTLGNASSPIPVASVAPVAAVAAPVNIAQVSDAIAQQKTIVIDEPVATVVEPAKIVQSLESAPAKGPIVIDASELTADKESIVSVKSYKDQSLKTDTHIDVTDASNGSTQPSNIEQILADSSHPEHKKTMDTILSTDYRKYTLKIRCMVIENVLRASEGTYSCAQLKAIHWFFSQPREEIQSLPTTKFVINEVINNDSLECTIHFVNYALQLKNKTRGTFPNMGYRSIFNS